MNITELTALELAQQLHTKRLSIAQVLDAYYAAIAEKNEELQAYISVCGKELTYARAAEIQARLDVGEIRSPLAGVPIAVKDVICTAGIPTTCGSRTLEHFLPPYNATIVERILAADMILLGKTNCDEFAMGSTTETSYFGITKNPRDTSRVPGGSSGGSAAAVAGNLAPIALGTDTGGSIRQPAAYCGIAGLKPTYGAVSRYGLIAYASSLDQAGPMGKNAADCAALFGIICGPDERDSTSAKGYRYEPPLQGAMPLRGTRIGIPQEFLSEALQPEIKQTIDSLTQKLQAEGAAIVSVSLPQLAYAVPTYYIMACAECCSNLSRYDGIKYGHSADAESLRETYIRSRSEGFGLECKRRVMLGNFVLSSGYFDAYYMKALKVRRLIQNAYLKAFESCDVILGPVAPTTAPRIGESLDDPLAMYLSDIYTVTVNLAGLPGLSLPIGKDSNGLPIGLQLIGKPYEDAFLLALGEALPSC
ncbi:MAG: Asp-tRNA(Asn)/Glu-tRNA(Gln) amidotransferase subunit GatA [Oscillospiraceae bacterium]|jgi:aspartyl-tRNA(Asn)/glutamyl-tRNA(Gln) amidotransferase subunit A|nr:Asp-tRNA(Asn)/Glu-tRNA(Gln) amidotransferase subunit GatA [Oscillospiraceae bacterium]